MHLHSTTFNHYSQWHFQGVGMVWAGLKTFLLQVVVLSDLYFEQIVRRCLSENTIFLGF